MQRTINWFEIPSRDFERASRFYEAVFAVKLRRETMENTPMGVFPYSDPATGGAVVKHERLRPSADGIVIYLNGGENLAEPLSRVEAAGGQVILPKTEIGPEGFIAIFADTEGNRIGLHSPH